MKALKKLYKHTLYGLFISLLLLGALSCGRKEPPRLPVYEPPPKPSILNAIHRDKEILIRWSYPEKKDIIKGAVILRSQDQDPFKEISFIENNTSYSDKDFGTSHVYRYKVIAKSIDGILGEPSQEIEINPLPEPSAPFDISFKIKEDSIDILWRHEDKNVFFNIYRGTEKGKYSINPLNKTLLKETLFNDYLQTDATVYYTVRALSESLIRDEGPASDEIKITPDDFIPSMPQDLRAVVTQKGIQLIWKENPEIWIRGYRVYRAEEGGEFKGIGEPQTPAFFDKQQSSGKLLYKVGGIGPAREGPHSEIIEAR